MNEILLQKYETEPEEYEITNFHEKESGFFYLYRHDFIGLEIKQNKVWEPHLHRIFEKYITKDSVVLEGGCHIGAHSVKLSKLSNKVYCFEPLKESNKILRKNLIRNNCLNTIVFDEALSDAQNITKFAWMPFYNLGGSGLDDNPMGIPHGENIATNLDESYPVKTVSIDFFNFNKLDFIKLDIEGYETKAINGAIETIKRLNPIIVLECWSNHFGQTDPNHTKEQFKILLDLGYSVEQVGISDWLFLPRNK
jgi:FkbM family methyltransferase